MAGKPAKGRKPARARTAAKAAPEARKPLAGLDGRRLTAAGVENEAGEVVRRRRRSRR